MRMMNLIKERNECIVGGGLGFLFQARLFCCIGTQMVRRPLFLYSTLSQQNLQSKYLTNTLQYVEFTKFGS